jgi:hypothetical protein
MKEGLLWFDNDPDRKLADKINQAVTRYQARFGRRPTTCYINSIEVNGPLDEINGIRLKPVADVRRHHFWIGVEQETSKAKAA